MKGPYSAHSLGRTNWFIRDADGERVCTLHDQRWDHTKLVAEAIAGVLNAAPADQDLNDTLKSMRDRGAV